MTDKLQVKEHLGNHDLYKPAGESYINSRWKTRLFRQYAISQGLKDALMESPPLYKWLLYFCVAIICFTFAIATYLGLINPVMWLENIGQVTKFNIPPIGLKDILMFVILVNGLTFCIRKRSYFF